MLSKLRVFLIHFSGGKFVGDNYMKPVVFHPLPEFAIGKFFSVDVVQAGIAVCSRRRFGHFDRESGQSETLGNKE